VASTRATPDKTGSAYDAGVADVDDNVVQPPGRPDTPDLYAGVLDEAARARLNGLLESDCGESALAERAASEAAAAGGLDEAASGGGGPIVKLEGVSKAFGPLVVLDDLSLSFRRGQCTVVLGPSGTGKSVMLKHIVGLLRPDAGRVWFDGKRVDTLPERQLVELRRRAGYLFQMGALFDSMPVGDNVAFPLVEHTRLDREQRDACVERVLSLVGLPGIQKQMPGQLSGGQRKRVALARAIVLQPCLVLYDEPTTGLDPIRSDVINELILSLTRRMGISSIVVTHDMQSANKVADRMVLLSDGKILCDGTPEQFRASPNEVVQRFIHGQADEEDLASIRKSFAPETRGPETPQPQPLAA
jgi:phospholipid/cholesterol/gamma-HCH transport system ATP-binding protein